MNTPAHLLVGTTVFAKRGMRNTYGAALLGAMAPDISLYVMVAVSIWGMGVPAEIVFREYYYSDAWQSVFAVDNSFVLWGLLFVVAVWRAWAGVIAFAGAALLHLMLDFPLHTHDARMHFWPLTEWVFESPVSYWDTGAYAGVVGPVEFMLSVLCAAILFWRFRHTGIRIVTVGLLALEAMSTGVWQFVF